MLNAALLLSSGLLPRTGTVKLVADEKIPGIDACVCEESPQTIKNFLTALTGRSVSG